MAAHAEAAVGTQPFGILQAATLALVIMMPTLALEIKGYSDNRGSSKLNETLSLRRAELTAKYFEAHGVDPELMTVEGMASASPLASNTSEDGRARNRRVEIAVVKQP